MTNFPFLARSNDIETILVSEIKNQILSMQNEAKAKASKTRSLSTLKAHPITTISLVSVASPGYTV